MAAIDMKDHLGKVEEAKVKEFNGVESGQDLLLEKLGQEYEAQLKMQGLRR